jgi:predicted flap endonuclease-1-like 5' DNA nuclease
VCIPLINIPRKELEMKAFKVFIFGLLYGWFVKLAIDRIYRGNEIEDLRNENAALQEYIRSLEAKLQPKALESKPARRTTARAESGKDDLKIIKGIGPALEKKLNAAGIRTFAALARLTVGELEDILGNTRRLVKEGELIAQAKKLAREREA